MADRVLNVVGCVLAVLIPLAVSLAAALLVRGPGPAVGSVVLVLTVWLLTVAGILVWLARGLQ